MKTTARHVVPFAAALAWMIAGCGAEVVGDDFAGDSANDAEVAGEASPTGDGDAGRPEVSLLDAPTDTAPPPDTMPDAVPDTETSSTACVGTELADTPPLSAMTPTPTARDVRALMLGRWLQYQGHCAVSTVVGMEFTDDAVYELARTADGKIERLSSHWGAWEIVVDSTGRFGFRTEGYSGSAPSFFDEGRKMHSLFQPWYTNLERIP
jgi:hypothetical protein